MSPDHVASSITLGNFTVGQPYRQKKSDMPDSCPTPNFASNGDKMGSVSSSQQAIYRPTVLSPYKIA